MFQSIKMKLVLVVVGILIIFFAALNLAILPEIESRIRGQKRSQVEDLISSTIGILEYYHNLEQEDELTRQEAQEQAVEAIKNSTYGMDNQDYFWINDHQPEMI
ncbi:MAG: cache domain-containing protein, partial [Halanaerobiales bacterium]